MKKLGWLWLALAFAAIIAAKFIFFPAKDAKSKPKNAAQVNVTVSVVKSSSINENLQITGSILPMEEAALQPEIQGRITGIYFSEGAFVKMGQLLVKINDSELQAQKNKLEVLLRNAEAELARQEKLLPSNATTREAYDLAQTNVASIKADLALNKAQIEKTEIRAPFDGQIGNRSISPGATIAPGTTIAKIYQSQQLKLEFQIPASYRNRISLQTTLLVEGSTGIKTNGKVYSIEPKADESGRTFSIRATIPSIKGINAGDFAKITVNLDQIPQAITVPTEAIVPILKGQQVFVVKNGKAIPTPVSVGPRNDTSILITQGLQVGDSVISSGLMFVKPGISVKVTKVKTP